MHLFEGWNKIKIGTYWNVKVEAAEGEDIAEEIKIGTYWNVKPPRSPFQKGKPT